MAAHHLKVLYVNTDGTLPGAPNLKQIWTCGPGPSHWTVEVVAIYAEASDPNAKPYHTHIEMTRTEAYDNWHRIPHTTRTKIRECKTISFND